MNETMSLIEKLASFALAAYLIFISFTDQEKLGFKAILLRIIGALIIILQVAIILSPRFVNK